MDYAEAVKKVRAEKPKDNFMVIKFDQDYSSGIVLPHKDGVALLSTLANAEKLVDRYSEPKRIGEINRDHVTTMSMSHQEYERFKIAALLDITPDEVKEIQEAANKQPT